MIHAIQIILLGDAEIVVVVGTEAAITPFGIGSFAAQRAISNDSRVYQADRKGFLMGEGAAVLVLESEESTLRREARVLAEVVGYGATTDGNPDVQLTDPDPSGGAHAVFHALKMSNLKPEDIGYLSAHATGTPLGDESELRGIQEWAGKAAWEIPIAGVKSSTGHLMGGAGAYAAALTTKMLVEGKVLANQGLTIENLDPMLKNHNLLMGEPKVLDKDHALINAFGFGGANAVVILRRAV